MISSKLYYQAKDELLMPSQTPACNSANLGNWTAIPGGVNTKTIPASPPLPSMPYKVFLPIIIKTSVDETGFRTGQIGVYNQEFSWNLSLRPALITQKAKCFYVCVEVNDRRGTRLRGGQRAGD